MGSVKYQDVVDYSGISTLEDFDIVPGDVFEANMRIEGFVEPSKSVVSVFALYSLGSERFRLKHPVNILMKYVGAEVLAVFPELNLWAEGENEAEAIEELKEELIDLADNLFKHDNEELSSGPRKWKQTLEAILDKV